MKKLFLGLMLAAVAVAPALADTYVNNDSALPVAAKEVIKKNFKSKVSLVKVDKDFGRIDEYEVKLSDGSEITFDSKGNWKEVEAASTKSVPASFVPKTVSQYVKKNHGGSNIVSIERKRGGYDVKLSNGIEMKFDKSGRFKKYDD